MLNSADAARGEGLTQRDGMLHIFTAVHARYKDWFGEQYRPHVISFQDNPTSFHNIKPAKMIK